MRYREFRVAPPLDRSVECIWLLSTPRGDAIEDPEQLILPDGCIEALFHLGGRFLALDDGAAPSAQPAACVAGMLTRPLRVGAVAGADTVGVRFRPGAAYPFFAGVHRLTDRIAPLGDLWPDASSLADRLHDAAEDVERVDILTAALTRRLRDAAIDRRLAIAVQHVVVSAGRAGIAAIARRVGVTPRHLERRFADCVGVAPKTLSRILRFQNTLRHRAQASGAWCDWVRIAVDCGYTDQSHLIRDYAQLAGETPASLRAAEGELSAYFTSPQRLAGLFDVRR